MFNGKGRFLTVLAIGMFCMNVNIAYASEIGPGYQNIQSAENEGSKGIIRSEADVKRVNEDGIYTYYNKNYYIRDKEIVTSNYVGDTWYTKFGIAASDEVYEFTGGVEEKDKAYWEAINTLASLELPNEDVTDVTVVKAGFPNQWEILAYINRVESIYNVTETPLHFAFKRIPPDSYLFLTIQNSQENIDTAKQILEGMSLIDQTYNDLGFANIEGEEAKIKAIHDWLANNIRYDFTYEKKKAIIGLTEGKMVCTGYTQLFYLFGKKAGIDVEVIGGVGTNDDGSFSMTDNEHIWNRVKLNGEYKYIDVTWDANVIDAINKADRNKYTEEEINAVKDSMFYHYYLKDKDEFNQDHFGFAAYK